MSHRRFERLAAEAIDFEPTPAERTELAVHLATCGACRALDSALRADARALRERPRSTPPVSQVGVVSATWARPVIRPLVGGSTRWLLVAAALLMVAAGVLTVGSQRRSQLQVPAPILPPFGTAIDLDVPAGAAAHAHLCHVIVASECGAAIAATGPFVWTSTATGIVRLDPNSGLLDDSSDLAAFPRQLAATADGSTWVAVSDPYRLERVPAAGRAVVEVLLAGLPSQMVVDRDALWFVLPDSRVVSELDATTGAELHRLRLSGDPWRIAAVDGAIWVVDRLATTLWRISATDGTVVDTIDLTALLPVHQNFASANGVVAAVGPMVGAFGRLWIPGESGVLIYDLASREVSTTLLPSQPLLAATPHGMAVVSRFNAILELLDPQTAEVTARQALDVDWSQWALPVSVDVRGEIWLRDYVRDRVIRITPR